MEATERNTRYHLVGRCNTCQSTVISDGATMEEVMRIIDLRHKKHDLSWYQVFKAGRLVAEYHGD